MDQYTIIYLLVLYKNTLNKIKRALIINALLVYNEVNNIIINNKDKKRELHSIGSRVEVLEVLTIIYANHSLDDLSGFLFLCRFFLLNHR